MRYLPEMIFCMVRDIIKNFWGLILLITICYIFEEQILNILGS